MLTMQLVLKTKLSTLEKIFRDFLSRDNWTSLRELSGFRSAVTLDDLIQGAVCQGVRLLDD